MSAEGKCAKGDEATADESYPKRSEQEIRLSKQEFNLLVEVFSTLRQWSLDLKQSSTKDAQGDNSRTQS